SRRYGRRTASAPWSSAGCGLRPPRQPVSRAPGWTLMGSPVCSLVLLPSRPRTSRARDRGATRGHGRRVAQHLHGGDRPEVRELVEEQAVGERNGLGRGQADALLARVLRGHERTVVFREAVGARRQLTDDLAAQRPALGERVRELVLPRRR